MNRLRLLWVLLRTFGGRGLVRRTIHEIRLRANAFQPRPRHSVAADRCEGRCEYALLQALSAGTAERRRLALERGQNVVGGRYQAYGHEWRSLPQTALQWRSAPRGGHEFPENAWWTLPHVSAATDIKDVWEPARFGWVYDLIRAYSVSAAVEYAEAFHRYFSSWQDAVMPFRGVHSVCGQEIAIRCLAVLHAMDCLPLPQRNAAAARQRIADFLGWSGERIADGIGYGLSQRNNHGISEACGLIHIGFRLREAHPHAPDWLRQGRRLLEEQIGDQFAGDGWYSQHSFTYMRLALEQALLAQRALLANGMTLPARSLDLLTASFRLLSLVVDPLTGRVPNHGANDGGRAAMLSSADYHDFRPVLTLASLILKTPLPADLAPDPDIVLWLGGAVPSVAAAQADGAWMGASGWVVARIAGTAVFMWAGLYRHRPSQMDALHLDVRFRHVETITDPGTFAYNAPPPWRNPLTSARYHNAPLLDDREPGERGPRFLWYSWPKARVRSVFHREDRAVIVAEVPGRVQRRVDVAADRVEVVDSVLDSSVASMRVAWLLHPDCRNPDCVHMPGSVRVSAVEGDVEGWFSPTYGLRVPAEVIAVEVRRSEQLELLTTIRAPAAGERIPSA